MKSILLLQQMLVLFAMMMCGFLAWKLRMVDKNACQKITTLFVNIFNPLLILSSVNEEQPAGASLLIRQDFIIALLYFLFITVCGYVFCFVRRYEKKKKNLYLLLNTFSNLGFMGIPLVKAVFGPEYIIFVVVYMMIFNVLAYTFGIYLAMSMSDTSRSFSLRYLLNPGMVTCVIAITLFLTQARMPAPVVTFCSYMGNTAIPLSMLIIGISLAQSDLKTLLGNKDTYIFLLVKMILIPVAGILLFRLLPFDRNLYSLFCLMVSMPCATIGGMFAQEYSDSGDEANRIVLLSIVISVITIPLVSMI